MVTLRCTRKLLNQIGTPSEVTEPSTTVLGDWFANLIYIGRHRFILLISEHSRFPVLMPGRDVKRLADNFPEALSQVLLRLGVSPFAIEREVGEMKDAVIAKTNNRSLLGTLNEFTFIIKFRFEDEPVGNPVNVALWLSDLLVGPLGLETPGEITKRLLEK